MLPILPLVLVDNAAPNFPEKTETMYQECLPPSQWPSICTLPFFFSSWHTGRDVLLPARDDFIWSFHFHFLLLPVVITLLIFLFPMLSVSIGFPYIVSLSLLLKKSSQFHILLYLWPLLCYFSFTATLLEVVTSVSHLLTSHLIHYSVPFARNSIQSAQIKNTTVIHIAKSFFSLCSLNSLQHLTLLTAFALKWSSSLSYLP